ncbi:hypothetical protein Q5P01_010627 [Channa striata]|uniref:Olfactomedin-like domain-containing protein n=1 Tax=Channa striata TaxID=64152 RepID=A0AA88MUY6_CHASR|nr:hypothetical protein Q5P01_010627 [Channa striata]
MWHRLSLLILCCAAAGLDALSADPGPPDRDAEQPTAEPLEDETDNQENIISQLLGDYDKVKTVSSGSDCLCRCIVRPIQRSDCGHPAPSAPDFYTVETVTKGTDCRKCVCTAPPSAVNPCEGQYRFQKLQDAAKDDVKLATIMDLLEGSLYGMDLLKLHSVTTKLLSRMDNMEKAFARNLTERTREKEHVKERAKEKEREKKAQPKKKKANDLERAPAKSGAPALANKQKSYEAQMKNQQQDGLEQQQPPRNKTGTQKKPIREKSSTVIRGVTFYMAEMEKYETTREAEAGTATSLNAETLLDLISDQSSPTPTVPTQTATPSATKSDDSASKRATQRPTARPITAQQITPTTRSAPATVKPATDSTTTAAAAARTTVQPTSVFTQRAAKASVTNIETPADASPTAASQPRPKSRLSWTESPADQPKATKKPAVCKDTVASISEPAQHNSYGLSDGAWMRDARGHGNVIYLTNGHYGNSLLEFRDMDTFKSGQPSNSYKLPYSFTGTGHVVFNGAFYYNRAFSRDVIRYDLRHRYVAAWTTLHDALLEEQAQRTQTEVEIAVDESGLWLLYPALDTEGFHQEVILLTHLRPRDLQPVRSFRTGLRRGHYGNTFLVCGVLYAVDSTERLYANVTYAFDTHTLTHTVPSLAFTNMHAHTSQLAYCPLDKKLYAWDNGHQMMYDVIFAY